MLSLLPIDEVLDQVQRLLASSSNLVLVAPPGAGKSTRVPPAVLSALGHQLPGRWIVLQPRRIAACAVASRIASEQGWQLGHQVGYQVRFDKRCTDRTPLLLMTDGLFLRQLQENPYLDGIAGVIFDEFHERSLNTDLSLALCRRVQLELRPELRIVVMSATLQAEPVAAYLGQAPVLHSPGRMFPVEVQHQRFADSRPLPEQIASAVKILFPATTGDLLVFLPGVGEIRQCHRLLEQQLDPKIATLLELYGELPLAEQQRVIEPQTLRKIILATNVAETSLTIPGVTAVIDSGLARVMRFDPLTGLNRLQVERISLASATQRTGRAGRTAPGNCQRLWTQQDERVMPASDTPELCRVDLSGAVLELLNWGESDIERFPWFESPNVETLKNALRQLQQWGAIDAENRLTTLGQRMVRLPLQPRLARLVLAGQEFGLQDETALLAAILSERDPFRGQSRSVNDRRPRAAQHHSDSDALDRLSAIEEFAQTKRTETWLGLVDTYAAKLILRVAEQIRSELSKSNLGTAISDPFDVVDDEADDTSQTTKTTDWSVDHSASTDELLMRALLAAFPDRVCKRREPNSPRAVMIGGRGVRLAASSAVQQAELFLAIELQESTGNEALVTVASAIERAWLDPQLLTNQAEVSYDVEREKIVAQQTVRYCDLILNQAATSVPKTCWPRAAELLAEVALAQLDRLFPLDSAVRQFLVRWESLLRWLPDAKLPALNPELLSQTIAQHCQGCTSLEELRRRPWLDFLRGEFDYTQLQLLEREAPDKILVPSGSRIALEYQPGKSPILTVRIQELFGLAATPRIAQGRVPVLLHLLGPNYRPQQVTEDLASFWQNTYPEVKKELKRRYPKHSWPDDPLTAPAVNKGGRRG